MKAAEEYELAQKAYDNTNWEHFKEDADEMQEAIIQFAIDFHESQLKEVPEYCGNCKQTKENCECDVYNEWVKNNPNEYHGRIKGESDFKVPELDDVAQLVIWHRLDSLHTRAVKLSDAQRIINALKMEITRQCETRDKLISYQLKKIQELEGLLDKYNLEKFARWLVKHGYCDTDVLPEGEDGVGEYLKEITKTLKR